MGERSSPSASSSSTFSSFSSQSVARTLGKVVPSFGRVLPSTTAPPSFDHPSLSPPSISSNPSIPRPPSFTNTTIPRPPSFTNPSIPPILTSTISTVMDATKNESVPLVSNNHQITSNPSHLPSQHSMTIPPSSSQPEVQCELTDDIILSLLDECDKVFGDEELRCLEFNAETIISTSHGMEKNRSERKSLVTSPSMLNSFEERETREEGNFLLLEVSDSADICELAMRERSDEPIQEFEDQEREGVGALVKRMIKGGGGPIKISEWADEVNIDDYYLKIYARAVCERLLPKGILKIKDGNFVMGETWAEYVHIFKIIYTQEVMVMLNKGNTISEKTISEDLGVCSLMDVLAMEWTSTAFIVEKKRGDTFVTKRL